MYFPRAAFASPPFFRKTGPQTAWRFFFAKSRSAVFFSRFLLPHAPRRRFSATAYQPLQPIVVGGDSPLFMHLFRAFFRAYASVMPFSTP